MHKYLKKYGGFRSRALPCPLADIYCRARFKNAFRAQKGTTVNGRARARERERAEEFVPICLKALCSCQWVEAASERMHARNERSTLFSCARITICSIRSRQSLKLFDARGLSISLLRPRTVHAALSTAFRVLIMNIVFYDPAFSFVSRFFSFFPPLSPPLFFSPSFVDYDFLVTDENHERVFFGGVLMTDVDRHPRIGLILARIFDTSLFGKVYRQTLCFDFARTGRSKLLKGASISKLRISSSTSFAEFFDIPLEKSEYSSLAEQRPRNKLIGQTNPP